MKLERGQIAAVTGAASGIGRALADAFCARGLSVVLADVNGVELERAHAAIAREGGTAEAVLANVAQLDDVVELRERALSKFGRVDVICNNAGIVVPFHACWEFTMEEWHRTLDINLYSVIHGINTFVPLFLEQGRGHILNTASMAGVTNIAYNGAYNASKHAIVALTEGLRLEFDDIAPAGATVLCPGLVRTRSFRGTAAAQSDPRPKRKPYGPIGSKAVIEAADCAQIALDAIEANALHAFTHTDIGPAIRYRFDRLTAAVLRADSGLRKYRVSMTTEVFCADDRPCCRHEATPSPSVHCS